jgi:acyl-CoA synthetase
MLNLTESKGIITPCEWRGIDYIDEVQQLFPYTPKLKYHITANSDECSDAQNLNKILNRDLEIEYPVDYLTQFKSSPNDIFLMNFSSGTTGLPKCVVHTPNRWIYFVHLAIDGGKLTSDDVILALVPNNSGFGLWTSHVCPIMLGTKTILLERFDAEEALRLIEREKVTMVTAVTTQFIKMLQVPNFSKYDLSSWRVMYTGGQDVPYEKVKELESRAGCTVLQFYGSVESGAVSRTVLGETLEQRTKTVGKPVPEMNVKLFDPVSGAEVNEPGQIGEVACNGPTMGTGYYNDPDNTKKLFNDKGWLLTGDLGTIGEDGYLRLVGRVKDIIIRGGQNVSAAEVEDAVCGNPKVAEVAVVAMPDPVFGEKACAFIVAKAGEDITFDELISYLNGLGIAKYKLPERLEVVDELPISPGGKVMKNVLRDKIAEKIKAEQER